MTDHEFWKLIESAKASSGGECETLSEHLMRSLLKLPPEELIAFDEIFDRLHDAAYRYDLWGAAILMIGLVHDDGFAYFRNWLIAQGQEVYRQALENPDSLADAIGPNHLDDEYECEEIWYVAGRAYEHVTGNEMYILDAPAKDTPQVDANGNPIIPEPAGTPWVEDDDLDMIFPRISARLDEIDVSVGQSAFDEKD